MLIKNVIDGVAGLFIGVWTARYRTKKRFNRTATTATTHDEDLRALEPTAIMHGRFLTEKELEPDEIGYVHPEHRHPIEKPLATLKFNSELLQG